VEPLLAQLPALLGVLLGAFSTIIAAAVNDRLRWRRSISFRWDEARLAAYADYARAVKGCYTVATRVAASRQPTLSPSPLDPDTGRLRLADAHDERTKAWESMLLLGDPAAVQAAREWRAAVWRLEELALAGTVSAEVLLERWRELTVEVNVARDRFYEAARQSLLVQGGPVPQASWLATDAPWRGR
jgi:hypothetical protein